jgi:hypothetical protein
MTTQKVGVFDELQRLERTALDIDAEAGVLLHDE